MNITSMDRLFVHNLKDIYNAEQQLLQALPKMAKASSSQELKEAFKHHLDETREQVRRLEKIFEHLEFSPTGQVCPAMKGLVDEAKEIIDDENIPSNVKDSALIAAAQKVEHYEIASYGTVVHFAKLLGDKEAHHLLSETLKEEKNTDKKLNSIATKKINKEALEEGRRRPSS